MRINTVIDDALMTEAMRATGLRTKRDTVELGLKTLLRLNQQSKLRQLRGKLQWQGDLEAMRRDSDRDFDPFAEHLGLATLA